MTTKTCSACRFYDGGECLRAASSSGEPIDPTSKATAQDGEVHCAGLHVSADFGCVQFEENVEVPDRRIRLSARFMALYGDFTQRFGGCEGFLLATVDSADLLERILCRMHRVGEGHVLVSVGGHLFDVPLADITEIP